MSTMAALAVVPDRRPVVLAEFRNGHGWSPSIWKRLMVHLGLIGTDDYIFSNDAALDALWNGINDQPAWQQVPNVLTFDTGVIPHQSFTECADLLDEFDRRIPAPEGHVNHVPGVAALLRSMPEAPLFGIHGTSVSENPFDPWDYEADEPGSGIPLVEMYVLPRHADMVSSMFASR